MKGHRVVWHNVEKGTRDEEENGKERNTRREKEEESEGRERKDHRGRLRVRGGGGGSGSEGGGGWNEAGREGERKGGHSYTLKLLGH